MIGIVPAPYHGVSVSTDFYLLAIGNIWQKERIMTELETRGLMEYFKSAVEDATQRLGVDISDHTEFYIVNLLFRYADARALSKEPIGAGAETFAELYLKSQGEAEGKRALILKYIGDTTLFLTGCFSDCFQRSLVDIDYYARLGRTSYRDLLDMEASRSVQWKLEDVFEELSKKYMQLMDVLAEVAATDGPQKAVDLLRIYDRWVRTRSKRDEALLRHMGIIPLDVSTPKTIQ
jgi:hypothetical protein